MKKIFAAFLLVSTFFVSLAVLSGCKTNSHKNTFIIWTDRKEMVSYAELFNSSQNKTKAIIVFKTGLSNSLPPARDEEKPDLIIGSWLKNSRTRKNYRELDALLGKDSVNTDIFYSQLISYGTVSGKQYLIPVSFDLPLMIFSTKNQEYISEKCMVSLDQVKEAAGKYNLTNKDGTYSQMGFGPSWDEDFLYLVTKENGPVFKEKGTSFSWNQDKLNKSVQFIKNWTTECNQSTTAELDFEFKYLYTPKYRQVTSGRTLFAYTTASTIFNIGYEQLNGIDYRWLSINGKLPVRDNIVSMGIYSKAKNPENAAVFIKWFFQEQNQKLMLERQEMMQLDTATFGIAGGFSSIINVNEHIFPACYRNLLGNLPDASLLQQPQPFPARWESLKERVIFPYLTAAVKTDSEKAEPQMNVLLNDWSKQFN